MLNDNMMIKPSIVICVQTMTAVDEKSAKFRPVLKKKEFPIHGVRVRAAMQ